MRTTLSDLKRWHSEQLPIAVMTCYDASFARVLEDNGVDILLIGDSLGMVLQGHPSPNPVTLEDVAYHTRCVARGSQRSLILADMPFGTSQISPQETFRNAVVLIQAGAQMVKIEGGSEMTETIQFLSERGIPVCAHIGMTPQSHHQYGGFKVQGRDASKADEIVEAAVALEKAGAAVILMECIPRILADRVCAAVKVPTIGIGASPSCSGQVLVLHDVIGLSAAPLSKLAKDYSSAAGGIPGMIQQYVKEVKNRTFPSDQHCY
jgi:3-methyl-2-oxobutanoate hydroxymethyltransferase